MCVCVCLCVYTHIYTFRRFWNIVYDLWSLKLGQSAVGCYLYVLRVLRQNLVIMDFQIH